MALRGYLIAEEGPLAGLVLTLEPSERASSEEKEDPSEDQSPPHWTLGRDPDVSDLSLEDPMVSRKHAIIRFLDEGFFLENLSTVNPVTQNGLVVADPVLLKEGDILQIGSTFFHFTFEPPSPQQSTIQDLATLSSIKEDHTPSLPSDLHFGPEAETRWLLKVISGPNTGAELSLLPNTTYLIGKDPNICDLVFQDLSVSRQHARLTLTEEPTLFIEDLGSRNGVIINGELVTEKHPLTSQDLIALGTTTFLVIDRSEPRETIFSRSPSLEDSEEKEPTPSQKVSTKEMKHWKELVIPKRHLIIAGSFFALVFTSLFAMVSLFKSEPIAMKIVDETDLIRQAIAKFPGVEFSFNQASGRLFLMGDVLTSLEHQELVYLLKGIPFVHSVEDAVIVDELVWQNMNALLMTNPKWVGVSMYTPTPGVFVLRGYTTTLEDAEALSDYINRNFDYLNKLENKVVVEKNLELEIQTMILEKELVSLNFELSNGEVVLSGKIGQNSHATLLTLVQEIKKIPGIRVIKNYVAVASKESMRLDISTNYSITGTSSRDGNNCFVVINGKILSKGDTLDGMLITEIQPKMVLLEKEGLNYVINYTLQ